MGNTKQVSFRYDVLNLEVLDDLREIFKKPSTEWSEDEFKKASLIIMAMRVVMDFGRKGKGNAQ